MIWTVVGTQLATRLLPCSERSTKRVPDPPDNCFLFGNDCKKNIIVCKEHLSPLFCQDFSYKCVHGISNSG